MTTLLLKGFSFTWMDGRKSDKLFSLIIKINFIVFLILTSLQSIQHEVTEIQNQLLFYG